MTDRRLAYPSPKPPALLREENLSPSNTKGAHLASKALRQAQRVPAFHARSTRRGCKRARWRSCGRIAVAAATASPWLRTSSSTRAPDDGHSKILAETASPRRMPPSRRSCARPAASSGQALDALVRARGRRSSAVAPARNPCNRDHFCGVSSIVSARRSRRFSAGSIGTDTAFDSHPRRWRLAGLSPAMAWSPARRRPSRVLARPRGPSRAPCEQRDQLV